MEEKKPLIFLQPLSESLKKLKEVMSESSEQDGIEIFEADSIEEMGQLLPNIGQSVVLTSNPKKCALMLQTNRKMIKALQSKVILLSPKAIPYRTLEKFMKIGLTECVVEPVAPKTLLYKVNLFIRSIGNKKSGGEINSKFGMEGKEQTEEEAELTVREKKEQAQAESVEGTVIDNFEKEESPQEEIIAKKKKNNFEEAPIESYYKGKNKKTEQIDTDPDSSESNYQEENIESYYKGDLKSASDVIEGDVISKRKNAPTEEELLEEIKKKVKISVEEDLSDEEQKKVKELEEAIKNKKKKAKLEIDADGNEHGEIREKEVEDLGGHYKGKVQKGLNVEDDEEDFVDEEDALEEELKDLKNKVKLDISDDLDSDDFIDKDEVEEESDDHKKKTKLKIVQDQEDKNFKDKKEQNDSETDDGPSIKLDVINDGDGINRDKLSEDQDEVDEEKKSKVKLNIQDVQEASEEDSQENEEEEDSSKKSKIKLNVKNDGDGSTEESDEVDVEESNDLKKKVKLKVQNVLESLDEESDESGEEDSEDINKRRVERTQKKDKDQRKTESWQEELGGDLKRKSGESFKEEENLKSNKADARADRIKTHYSSKESIKHQDDDWGNKWKKGEKQQEEYKGPKEELALIIEKDDLGEQTIDYKSLKEQFENASFDGVRNKRKKYGIFSEKTPEVRLVTKTIYHEDGTTEEVTVEEIVGEEEKEVPKKVYEPKPVGLDVAVEVLGLYFIKQTKPKDVLHKIGQKIWDKYKAKCAFYFFDKAKGKYDEEFTSISGITLYDSKEELEEQKLEWKILRDINFNSWQFVKLPFWSDTTYREKKIQFVYPYFEGVNSMGFAVVSFENGLAEEDSKTIEMIVETARGFYLDKTHEISGNRKDYGKKKDSSTNSSNSKDGGKEKGKGEKQGFFKKLFGWAS